MLPTTRIVTGVGKRAIQAISLDRPGPECTSQLPLSTSFTCLAVFKGPHSKLSTGSQVRTCGSADSAVPVGPRVRLRARPQASSAPAPSPCSSCPVAQRLQAGAGRTKGEARTNKDVGESEVLKRAARKCGAAVGCGLMAHIQGMSGLSNL